MAIPTLSGSYIDETYIRLVQVSGSEFSDGLGNTISFGPGSLSGGIDGYIPIWSGSIALSNSIISQTTNRLNVSGSLNVIDGITGSLAGTASWAYNVVNMPTINTASFVTNNQTGSMTVLSSSYSSTASYIDPLFISASAAYYGFGSGSGGSNIDTSSFVRNSQTSSFITNSQTSSFVLNSQTGSMLAGYTLNSQTSSFVTNAQTSSFVTNSQTSSFLLNSQTGSMLASYTLNSQTSSFIRNTQTGSFATTGSNIFRGNQTITGSLIISGSNTFIGSNTNWNPGLLNVSTNSDKSVATSSVFVLSTTENGTASVYPQQLLFDYLGSGSGWGIQSANQGVIQTPLYLNRNGGNVNIGQNTLVDLNVFGNINAANINANVTAESINNPSINIFNFINFI